MNYYFFALLLVCCLYAFVAGGAPERLGAAIYALGCLASHLAFSAPLRFRSVETGVLIVDVLAFAAFILLALRANRFWPIWVSALLGLGVLAHLARWTGPSAVPWAYQVIMSIWSYPILAIIAIGTFNHRRRLVSFGADQSWSRSSGSSAQTPPPGRAT